jgi:hypothetical protein
MVEYQGDVLGKEGRKKELDCDNDVVHKAITEKQRVQGGGEEWQTEGVEAGSP